MYGLGRGGCHLDGGGRRVRGRGAAAASPRACSTSRTRAPRVGSTSSDLTVSSTPQASLTSWTSFIASRECPPEAKKSSSGPAASTPSTSAQMSAMTPSTCVRCHVGRRLRLDHSPLRRAPSPRGLVLEGRAVHLAVRCQREALEPGDRRRHHVGGQLSRRDASAARLRRGRGRRRRRRPSAGPLDDRPERPRPHLAHRDAR